VLTSHVVVRESASKLEAFAIKQKIRFLLEDLDLAHSTVEIEFGDDDCGLKA